MTHARRQQARREELEQEPVQGHRHALGRRLRRARRQPEEDPHLGRPDQAGRPGRHAEPVHVGRRRWNIMAGYGAMLRAKKTPKQAVGVPEDALQAARRLARQERPRRAAARSAAGRGDVLLTYENEALFANSKGIRTDYYIPKATLRIDNPVAVTTNSLEPGRGEGVREVPLHAGRAEDLRRQNGYRPVVQERAQGLLVRRAARRCSRSTTSAAGPKVDKKFFDPKSTGSWPRSSATGVDAGGSRAAALGAGASGRPSGLLVAGDRDRLPERHRPAAAGGADVEGGRGRLGGFWDAITAPEAVAALKLTLVVSLVVALINAVMGTVIAWMLVRDRFPRPAVRRRDHRPAVRAADDRRRPDAARALRAERADAGRHRVHAHGGARRAALRDAAVRRPHRAAGADRARPRDGGGGRVARRERRSRSSGASSSRSSSRRSSRASRSRSRARSASSARSS